MLILTPAKPYHILSRSSKLKNMLRSCHSPLSDISALRDLTRNRHGEPALITLGSEVTTSVARGADFDPLLDGRPCKGAIGDITSARVATTRGMFTYSVSESEVFETTNSVPRAELLPEAAR